MKGLHRRIIVRSVFLRLIISCLLLSFFSTKLYALESVVLQLKWKHQFQFAGYYMAKELGIYESAGLDVSIIEAHPGIAPIEEVVQGRADFGVGTSDLVRYRAEGYPVVVLGVIFQHSPMVIITPKHNASYSIHDLVKLPIMIEPHAADVWAYFQNEGVDIQQVNNIEHSFDVNDLISGKASGMAVYLTDEPFTLEKKGFEYQVFYPRTAGIDFYADNFFTTEALIKNKPELVRAFVKATTAGWKYAMSHTNETVDVIYNRYSQRHSKEHLQFEAEKMLAFIQPDIVEPGYMNKGRWQHIIDTYMQLGIIQQRPDIDGFLYATQHENNLTGLYRIMLLVFIIVVVLSLLLSRFIWLNWRLRQEIQHNKKIEDELRLSSKKIEAAKTQAEKANTFKSHFLASVSHDLRTPLTAVIGFSEQALLDYRNNKDCSAALDSVLNNSRNICEMINELADLAQIESDTLQVKPVMLELQSLLQELDVAMKEKASLKQINFNLQLQWPLPRQLYIDAIYLRQVFFNLLNNAIKFTDNGMVTLQVSASDDHLLCKVIDTGIGIDESLLDDLFQPFVQANKNIKTNYGGTGLGLYITKALIEKMQGVMGVDSKLGQGSCFYFKLPIGIDKPHFLSAFDHLIVTEQKDIPLIDQRIKGKILIADDSKENQQLLAIMLKAPELELVCVSNGQQALDKIDEQHFDLVLMDIQMPVMTGVEAIVQLRERDNNISVIALSANISGEQKKVYFQVGFDGVLEKPINRTLLFQLIADYLSDDSKAVSDSQIYEDTNAAYTKISKKLAAALPQYVESMTVLFNSANYGMLKKEAHRFIGSCGTLGFVKISDLLIALEDAAADNNKNACEAVLQQLRVEVESL